MTYPINAVISSVASPPIAEAARWLEENRSGLKPVNLSQAVPSYSPAEALADHAAQAIRDGSATLYTDILGIAPLRAELAAHMATGYRGTVSAADVAITAGCNAAFCQAIMALAGHGDNVVLTTPWYFNHHMWLQMNGIEVRSIAATGSNGALPDPADLAGACDGRTRALVLISPNNPTGAVYPPQLLDEFYDACERLGIALVLDETYKDFLDPSTAPHNLFRRDNWRNTFVQLFSFSKSYALTGQRVGSLIAGPALIETVEKIQDCITICAPHVAQISALYGLRHLDGWKAEKRTVMADRLAAMRTAFAAHAPQFDVVSSGAFFAYIRHPYEGRSARDVAMALARDTGVLTLPGTMFGPGQEQYLRIAFANVEAGLMVEAARRLGEHAQQQQQHGSPAPAAAG
jgi:aspartate/methionine/tyrosine aminotransferase